MWERLVFVNQTQRSLGNCHYLLCGNDGVSFCTVLIKIAGVPKYGVTCLFEIAQWCLYG